MALSMSSDSTPADHSSSSSQGAEAAFERINVLHEETLLCLADGLLADAALRIVKYAAAVSELKKAATQDCVWDEIAKHSALRLRNVLETFLSSNSSSSSVGCKDMIRIVRACSLAGANIASLEVLPAVYRAAQQSIDATMDSMRSRLSSLQKLRKIDPANRLPSSDPLFVDAGEACQEAIQFVLTVLASCLDNKDLSQDQTGSAHSTTRIQLTTQLKDSMNHCLETIHDNWSEERQTQQFTKDDWSGHCVIVEEQGCSSGNQLLDLLADESCTILLQASRTRLALHSIEAMDISCATSEMPISRLNSMTCMLPVEARWASEYSRLEGLLASASVTQALDIKRALGELHRKEQPINASDCDPAAAQTSDQKFAQLSLYMRVDECLFVTSRSMQRSIETLCGMAAVPLISECTDLLSATLWEHVCSVCSRISTPIDHAKAADSLALLCRSVGDLRQAVHSRAEATMEQEVSMQIEGCLGELDLLLGRCVEAFEEHVNGFVQTTLPSMQRSSAVLVDLPTARKLSAAKPDQCDSLSTFLEARALDAAASICAHIDQTFLGLNIHQRDVVGTLIGCTVHELLSWLVQLAADVSLHHQDAIALSTAFYQLRVTIIDTCTHPLPSSAFLLLRSATEILQGGTDSTHSVHKPSGESGVVAQGSTPMAAARRRARTGEALPLSPWTTETSMMKGAEILDALSKALE